MTGLSTRAKWLHSFALVAFLAGLLSSLAAPAVWADEGNGVKKDVTLVGSWPEQGFEMWLPPQQGRLEFSGPVRTSSMTLELKAVGPDMENPEQVTRLTRGESATRVLFRFPVLQEGDYELLYAAETASGGQVTGSIDFSLGPRFTAPGGGNHRHSGGHIEYDTPWHLALRALLVIASSLLLFACYRARRGFVSLWDAILPRVASVLMLGFAVLAGATTIVEVALDSSDSPLAAAFASPALWVYLPVFIASALIIVTGARGRATATVAFAALVLTGFSSQHGDQSWAVLATVALTALLVSAALLLTSLWVVVSSMVSPAPRPTGKGVAAAAGLSLLVVGLSMSLVVAHARGIVFYGDLANDAMLRVGASGGLLIGVLVLYAVSLLPRATVRRALVAIPSLVILAAATALLWLPPPSSGL